jgi:muramoyltetrapeptide carboxypeptidase LdcA involved in peptidoglycan recycling
LIESSATGLAAMTQPWQFPLTKPRRLVPGDRVAVVTPGWGGPGAFLHRYRAGKEYLESAFGLDVVEMPNALRSPSWLEQNPKARADDLHAAFSDPEVKAVIASIGGEDTIRLIPHVDLAVIAGNPKILLGYSDVTILHFGCLKAGVGSFYGPMVMSGFAENCGMHKFAEDSIRAALFDPVPAGELRPNSQGWTVERLEWADPRSQAQARKLTPTDGPRLLQGQGRARGRLVGGCADSMEMLKATAWWPPLSLWRNAILFYETSEEVPPPEHVRRWLRNFGVQGILSEVSGFMFGRPGGQIEVAKHTDYERVVVEVMGEFAARAPVMANMDFGHTDPIMTLPYGAEAEIDCERGSVSILENVVV